MYFGGVLMVRCISSGASTKTRARPDSKCCKKRVWEAEFSFVCIRLKPNRKVTHPFNVAVD